MAEEPRHNDKDAHQARMVRNARIGFIGVFVVLPLLIFLIFGLQWYFSSALEVSERKDLVQGLASAVQALAVLAASVVGLAGLYFTRQTLLHNQRTLQTNQENTQRTLELTEQGQITERFTRAIDNSELRTTTGNQSWRSG